MRKILSTSLALLFSAGLTLAADAPTSTYQEISRHYAAIRLALLADSLTGVADHAASIEENVTRLGDDFDAERAGVTADQVDECKNLLPEIAAGAQQIAQGANLDEIRSAFFELSKPLGRYRKLTGDLDSKVMFCPMAKKAWIQTGSEVGNPYLGTDMPSCGQVVAD